ncbi:hypothetical protein [Streptomyces bobili]|uniref:hypothetical protein n=1 Tax=Streptomyces bobili TaxID=67280 RepID=UPI00371969ED
MSADRAGISGRGGVRGSGHLFAQFEGIEDRIALAERAVVLTVLFEPVVRLLRRLAQEDANHRRHHRRACERGEQPTE